MRHVQTALMALVLTGCSGLAAHQDLVRAPSPGHFERGLDGETPLLGSIGGVDHVQSADTKSDVAHRLIRTGSMTVVVPAFTSFETELKGWLTASGGFVSDANLSHHEGHVGWADITIRVPADQFDALVDWTEEQVKVEHLSIRAQDVTEEWVDVEARISNNQREEAVLIDLLGTEAASLADVLAVERELARVRGEIESAQGQMRVLSDRVSLATLQLGVRVEKPYTPLVADRFSDQIGQAFIGSIEVMRDVAKGLTLVTVAAAPWLIIVGAGFTALVASARRRWRATLTGKSQGLF